MKKEEFLAISLPFGLKGIDTMGDIAELIIFDKNGYFGTDLDIEEDAEELHTLDGNFLPILRPLSELEQILLFEFEKYHQNIDCNNEIIELFCEEHIKTSDLITEVIIENLPFSTVFWMIKNHFDIAGLIGKGEAIDVNTLIENPYK